MKNIPNRLVIFSLVLMTLVSCKKDECRSCIEENLKPKANAGLDQTILLQMDAVLDGKLSYDRNVDIAAFKWSVVSGPSGANIDNANLGQTFARFTETGIYQFELRVTNTNGIAATDTVQVNVETISSESICNRPVVSAKLVPIGRISGPRSHMKTTTAGNKIFFAGGWTPGFSGTVDIYDIVTNSWASAALSDEGIRADFAMASLGNKVFFAGGGDYWNGFHTPAVDIYDAVSNSWSKANLSQARTGVAAAAAGNTVVFAGGGVYDEMLSTGFQASDVVDIYNNATNTWTTAKLSEPRMFINATTWGDDIYFSGGTTTFYGASDKIDIYNSKTNTWSVSKLKVPGTRMEGIVDQNTLFLAAYNGNNDGSKFEIIDLNTGTSTLDCMIPRDGYKAIRSGDKLIFFTGSAGPGDLRNGSVFEIYNTQTKEWSVGVLNRSVSNPGIISINNTIYVAGGRDPAGKTVDGFWKLEF